MAEQPVSDAGPQAVFCRKLFPAGRSGGHEWLSAILKLIHDDWQKSPAKIKEIGDQVQATLSRADDTGGKSTSVLNRMPADWLATARDQFLGQRDKVYGGLDGGGGTTQPSSDRLSSERHRGVAASC